LNKPVINARPCAGFFVDDEMLAMGADLQEAKQLCKEHGKLFEDWCDSGECPVMYKTAQKLMSVQSELGAKKEVNFLFNHGFEVLSKVTQTRDEDIRQALLEHIEQARHQCPAKRRVFCFSLLENDHRNDHGFQRTL
jgi:hypothetical protein